MHVLRRYQPIINNLCLGEQCSSCGERFPCNEQNLYREHLDWHFRQNRKEKDGVRKVSSRAWYYDLNVSPSFLVMFFWFIWLVENVIFIVLRPGWNIALLS